MKNNAAVFILSLGLLCGANEAATATEIGNCDHRPHRLTYAVGGELRHTTLVPGQQVFVQGPMIDASVDKGPMKRLGMFYDYCIWHSEIEVQKRNVLMRGHGGSHQ